MMSLRKKFGRCVVNGLADKCGSQVLRDWPWHRPGRWVLELLFVTCLTACGGSSGSNIAASSGSTEATTVESPTLINLYPHQSSAEDPIFTLMVTSVGSVPVSMPLGFDSGSAGVTLYAQSIFPASMVSASGFVFPSGQNSITYNGITVTNLQGTRSYGTLNQTVEHGNLGFTSLTFGDSAGTVTTLTMPVFLFYSVDYLTGNGYRTPTWQGWFGVASTNGTIDVSGSVEPAGGFSACTPPSTGTCYVVSGLKYVDYGNQVNAGFMLSPTPNFPTCDITTPGSCAPQAVLTVGVNAALEQGFSTSTLTCPPNGYVGPPEIGGYPVCQKTIGDVTIAATGASTGTYTSGVIFDTGTAYVYLSTPTNSSLPSSIEPGSTISITTPSGFNYSYEAGSGTANTVVASGADGNSIIGVQYFRTNYFLLDFTSSLVGWK
jgi:hypothetical protein